MLRSLSYKLLLKRTLTMLLVIGGAGATCSAQEPSDGQSVIAVVTSRPVTDLLPETLGGIRSSSEARHFRPADLGELVGERAPVFLEYGVNSAAARDYGDYRVEVFQTSTPVHAFGLFTYNSPQPVDFDKVKESSSAMTRIAGGAILWESSFFVTISTIRKRSGTSPITTKLSSDIAAIAGEYKGPARVPVLPG